jgi:transketolase
MMSDGEFQEGQTWETFQALSNYRLDNIGIYVDVNGQQCDGLMSDVMRVEPLKTKLEAFGLRVFLVDGQDVEALAAPAELAPNGMPLLVLAYTDPCAGLDILRARAPKLHYVRFKDETERQLYRSTLLEMER